MMAREFDLKNPTPLGAAKATSLGSVGQHKKPYALTHKERQGGQGEPNRRKGAAGKGAGDQQGLHCGEANPNQGLDRHVTARCVDVRVV